MGGGGGVSRGKAASFSLNEAGHSRMTSDQPDEAKRRPCVLKIPLLL